MVQPRAAVIMAAGLGTRMRSQLVKVLHPVAGRPMIHYPVRAALELEAERVVVIVGHQRARVAEYLEAAFPGAPIQTAVQAQQRGTAHAVRCAREALEGFEGSVFILSGDVPALPASLIARLDERAGPAACALLSMYLDAPGAYGRVVRDLGSGRPLRIVEAADASPDELEIGEVNCGVYRIDAAFLWATLDALGVDNAQGEYYLTDLVEAACRAGLGVYAEPLRGDEAAAAGGVNDRIDLAAAEARLQARLRVALMRAGVSFVRPESVVVHDGVEVGCDTLIEAGVALLGETRIGPGCHLEQGVYLKDTVVGAGSRVLAYTVADRAEIGPRCNVGPFARLREGTVLGAEVKLGNFVETKKAQLGRGVKASHLSYLGDATIGAGSNIGAGTITCNYDGAQKHQTVLGERVFVGSDSQLVAPIRVGDGAYIGAGTTVVEDVPPGDLAIGRARQRNIAGWVERRERRRKE